MGPAGYGGRHVCKASSVREGCATFWREARFREVAHKGVVLRDEVLDSKGEGLRGARALVREWRALWEAWGKLGQVVSVSLLEDVAGGGDREGRWV